MHNILLQIIEQKHKDLYEQKNVLSMDDLKRKTAKIKSESNFKNKIVATTDVAIIAEIKLASPTTPSLGSESDIIQRAIAYDEAGADVISFITEKHYFKGSLTFISQLKTRIKLPILQKDFVVDPYQIYEAKFIGSDALLLIARLVDKQILRKFVSLAHEIGIEPVVEVNDEEDLQKAVATTASFIAVNARDLRTFAIDIDQACNLLKKIPNRFIKLAFSGIHSPVEVGKYQKAGAKGVLVGTSLMKATNIPEFINTLRRRTVKVKICGIRSKNSAIAAIESGADFLGFNFIPDSKRFITPTIAKRIINKIKGQVKIVGVFQNMDVDYINSIVDLLNLDFIQLHDKEGVFFNQKMNTKVIQAIRLTNKMDINQLISNMKNYKVSYFLLDREKQGEGEMLNKDDARTIAQKFKVFLAGGLQPDNVAEMINRVRPYAVDVASGIETDGFEDAQKIKTFIANAKGVYL